MISTHFTIIVVDLQIVLGVQWLRCRVLDSRPRGGGCEPHQRHCYPWTRHINPSLVLFPPRKTLPYITERLLMGRKESNQTNKLYSFPANTYNCGLLTHLLKQFGSLKCKQYGPRSDCSLVGSSLIRVHSVGFCDHFLVHLYMCSRCDNETTFYYANNMVPDQTAPRGAVWSGFIVFASVMIFVWSALEYVQQMW